MTKQRTAAAGVVVATCVACTGSDPGIVQVIEAPDAASAKLAPSRDASVSTPPVGAPEAGQGSFDASAPPATREAGGGEAPAAGAGAPLGPCHTLIIGETDGGPISCCERPACVDDPADDSRCSGGLTAYRCEPSSWGDAGVYCFVPGNWCAADASADAGSPLCRVSSCPNNCTQQGTMPCCTPAGECGCGYGTALCL